MPKKKLSILDQFAKEISDAVVAHLDGVAERIADALAIAITNLQKVAGVAEQTAATAELQAPPDPDNDEVVGNGALTAEVVREALKEYAKENGHDAAVQLLAAVGAENVTGLAEEHYRAVFDACIGAIPDPQA